MDSVEIYQQIIDTDKNAQKLYRDAISYQESLAEDLSQLKKQLREQKYAEARKYIAAAEREAISDADEKISELNRQLDQDLNRVRREYNRRAGELSDTIFKAAVKLEEVRGE